MRLLDSIVTSKTTPEKDILENGFKSCLDLLSICQAIAPGKSRLLGKNNQ